MVNLDLKHAKKIMLGAAGLASKRLLDRFETTLEIDSKGRSDFVTNLDHECEIIIREELAKFDDSIEFVGEESSDFPVEDDKVKIELPSTCFIVDPVDGTSNYMHSFDGYCVSVGLMVDDELVVGVIQAPSLGKVFVGVKGEGSYRSDLSGNNEVKLKTVDDGDRRTLFATSVPFRQPEYIEEHLKLSDELYKNFEDMRRVGSCALDLSWVAQGSFGLYIERFLRPWDCSGGAVILREAGGIISDWQGDETQWLYNGQIFAASSPRVHEKALSLLQ